MNIFKKKTVKLWCIVATLSFLFFFVITVLCCIFLGDQSVFFGISLFGLVFTVVIGAVETLAYLSRNRRVNE